MVLSALRRVFPVSNNKTPSFWKPIGQLFWRPCSKKSTKGPHPENRFKNIPQLTYKKGNELCVFHFICTSYVRSMLEKKSFGHFCQRTQISDSHNDIWCVHSHIELENATSIVSFEQFNYYKKHFMNKRLTR